MSAPRVVLQWAIGRRAEMQAVQDADMDDSHSRLSLRGIVRWAVWAVLLQLTIAIVLFGALLAFVLIDSDLFSQPPRKIYTASQFSVAVLRGAAGEYHWETGRWPLDDAQSTFLYKLMGGGKRPPYLKRDTCGGIYGTCEVYNMTSPSHSPWAGSVAETVPNPPFLLPLPPIKWPDVYHCDVTAYGGWSQPYPPAWDEVPTDPAICPWMATDVVGYDTFGGRYRAKIGLFGYTVYSDGENRRDNGGFWDDIHAKPTIGLIAAYHTGDFLFFLMCLAALLYAWYRFLLIRIWRRLFAQPAGHQEDAPRSSGPDMPAAGVRRLWTPAVIAPIAAAGLFVAGGCLCVVLVIWGLYSMSMQKEQKEQEAAVEPYLQKAKQGDAAAQLKLAEKYASGDGLLYRDTEQALLWYRKAADQGNAKAQVDLGGLYYIAEGVRFDRMEAARWFRKAAERGNADGMNGLAFILVSEPGMLHPEEALTWAKEAVRAQPGYWAYLDTLACAYAANGEFETAVMTERRALDMAQDSYSSDYSAAMIDAFRKKMTYLEYKQSKTKLSQSRDSGRYPGAATETKNDPQPGAAVLR
jgi:hypothetical protein